MKKNTLRYYYSIQGFNGDSDDDNLRMSAMFNPELKRVLESLYPDFNVEIKSVEGPEPKTPYAELEHLNGIDNVPSFFERLEDFAQEYYSSMDWYK